MIKDSSVQPAGYIERSKKVNVVSKTGTQAMRTAETNISECDIPLTAV